MSAPNLDTILNGLDKVRKSGSGWTACCPSHDDHDPSLSISEGRTGKVLVKCWAGCSQNDVITALRGMGLWGSADGIARPAPRPRDTGPDPDESRRMRQAAALYKSAGAITDFPDLITYLKGRGLDPNQVIAAGARAARIPRARLDANKTPPGWIAGEVANALLYPIYHPDDIFKDGEKRLIGVQREWPWGRPGGPRSVKAARGKTHAPGKAGAGGFLIGALTHGGGAKLDIVEGQLTGFGVAAATGGPVLVLYTAGGLAGIGGGTIRDLMSTNPSVRIAGDADPSRAGEEKGAEPCAGRILDIAPKAHVTISIPEGEKVDWLDVSVEHGPEAAARLLTKRERAPSRPPAPNNVMPLVPWERIERQPREPEQSLEEAERSVLAAVRGWEGAASPTPTIVRVTPGVGKTHQMIETIRASDKPFLILCPTLDDARAVAAQIPDARLHVGRNEKNCKKFVTVAALTERRRAPHAHACLTCEHGPDDSSDPCEYMPALRASVYSRVMVAAHGAGAEDSLLYSHCPDPANDVNAMVDRRIVCDESPAVNIETKIEAAHITEWRAGVARAEALLNVEEARLKVEIELAERFDHDRFDQDQENAKGRLAGIEKARAWVRAIAPELDSLALALAAAPADRALHPMTGFDAFVKLAGKVPRAARHVDATLVESVDLRHAQTPVIPLKAIEALGATLTKGDAYFEEGAIVCMTTGALWKQIIKRGGLLLDATPGARQAAEVEAVGGKVVTVRAEQPLHIIQRGPQLHGRGGLKGSVLARAVATVAQLEAEGAVVITHKPTSVEADSPSRIRYWGRHKAHNDWEKEDRLALYGLPLLSPRDQLLQYRADRAALAAVGVEWAEWDGAATQGQTVETDGWRLRIGAHLPAVPQARVWLLDRLAADVAQAIGRLRAVRRARPGAVEVYGLLPLVGHGIHVEEMRLESHGRLHNKTRARAVIAQGVVDLGEARTRAKLMDYFKRHAS